MGTHGLMQDRRKASVTHNFLHFSWIFVGHFDSRRYIATTNSYGRHEFRRIRNRCINSSAGVPISARTWHPLNTKPSDSRTHCRAQTPSVPQGMHCAWSVSSRFLCASHIFCPTLPITSLSNPYHYCLSW